MGYTDSPENAGWSFFESPASRLRVPSEDALRASQQNGFDTIYARGADSVSQHQPNRPRTLHALHTVRAVAPNMFSTLETVQESSFSCVNTK